MKQNFIFIPFLWSSVAFQIYRQWSTLNFMATYDPPLLKWRRKILKINSRKDSNPNLWIWEQACQPLSYAASLARDKLVKKRSLSSTEQLG